MSQATLSPVRVPVNPVQLEHTSEYRELRYLPSPEEIRQACLEIQSEWTEEERLYRERANPWEMHESGALKRNKADRTCQDCGEPFTGHFQRLRCDDCDGQHRLRYQRDRARKAVKR